MHLIRLRTTPTVDNNLQQISDTNAIRTTPSVSYIYDTNYNRLLTMTDGTGLTTYAYNAITSPRSLGAARSRRRMASSTMTRSRTATMSLAVGQADRSMEALTHRLFNLMHSIERGR
jgi:hypothetical protein